MLRNQPEPPEILHSREYNDDDNNNTTQSIITMTTMKAVGTCLQAPIA